MSKAQAATEYLVILAVVIIIALIVIGVMGGIPQLGTSGKSRVSESYWASQLISLESYAIDRAGFYSLLLKNNNKKIIFLQRIQIGDASYPSVGGSMSIPIATGETFKITYRGGPITGICVGGPPFCQIGAIAVTNRCNTGQSYSYNLSITYQDEAGSIFVISGEGNTVQLIGICSNRI